MAQEPFGDIPLFREIQRLLASSGGGPINFEIARQVAAATSRQGPADIPPSDQQVRVLIDAVRNAEQLVAGYSRIQIDEPTKGAMSTRASWISASLDGWKWLLEHLAERFTGELAGMTGDRAEDQMSQVMGQVGPLLLGLQTGTLIGNLSNDVLDTTDPPIPRDGEDGFHVVIGNVAAFASGFDLDIEELIRWLALHGVAYSLATRSAPWVTRYQRGLLLELVDAIEIDTGQLEQRLLELQSGGLEGLEGAEAIDRSIPVVETERHRAALDRVRAFVALLEGYSAHIAAEVESELVEEPARLQEGVARHRASPSEGKAALASLLGFSSDRELEAGGRTFCEAIVKLEGLTSLNRVWDAPDNLPNLTEIRDPFVWIDRVLKQG
ncbi:MAG TPA: zinc-dependent metalloprotease [Actinomycetota bacterium]|nr:zinc-dependent metalloprotease [Actinomycetota bacterium]